MTKDALRHTRAGSASLNDRVWTTFLPDYSFREFLVLQDRLRVLRGEQKIPQMLVFATHEPCYSLGAYESRRARDKNFKVQVDLSAHGMFCRGIPIFSTRRGGEVTYHGPKILGCYTIFSDIGYGIDDYFLLYRRMVEHFLHPWRFSFETHGNRSDLWIETKKIMSAGLQFHGRIASFGFNLNVGGDITPFEYIYPCGIRDSRLSVTSLERELSTQLDTRLVADGLCAEMSELMPQLEFRRMDCCSFFSNLKPLLSRKGFLFCNS